MKTTKLLIPAAILAAFPATLAAQGDGPRDRDGRGHPPVPPIIRALDKDGDGVISKGELAEAPSALATLDANNDGELTRDELRPPPPPREDGADPDRPRRRGDRKPPEGDARPGEQDGERPGPPPPPIIVVLDADHDGVISAEEIENAAGALAELDLNEDGELTRDELRPPRPDGPPPHEGDDGGESPEAPRHSRRGRQAR